MKVRRFTLPMTVDASGAGTFYTPPVYGEIISFRYVKENFVDGIDFVCTMEKSGETLWAEDSVNVSATRYPRAATQSTTGAASLYAAGGTDVNDRICIAGERIKVVVDGAGNATSGTLHVTINGS